jgi:hypothetical protein
MDHVLAGLILHTLTAACLEQLQLCQGMQAAIEQARTLPALQEALRRHNEQFDIAEIACRGQLESHLVGAQCGASIFFVHRPSQERCDDREAAAGTRTLPVGSR